MTSKNPSSYLEFDGREPENYEEYKATHHRIAMEEIFKYKNVDLKKIPRSQMKRAGNEFGMMIAASLSYYANTTECDEKVLEINRVLIQDKRFQSSLKDYLDSRYKELTNKGTRLERYYRHAMILYLQIYKSNQTSVGTRLFCSARQENLSNDKLCEILKI